MCAGGDVEIQVSISASLQPMQDGRKIVARQFQRRATVHADGPLAGQPELHFHATPHECADSMLEAGSRCVPLVGAAIMGRWEAEAAK